MKIAYLDPVSESAWFEEIAVEMRKYQSNSTMLDYHCLQSGGESLEYITFEAMMAPLILQKVKQLEKDYDAVIIGCFLDPFLDELKECCKDTVIVGVCEAAVKIGSSLGKKMSIIAPLRKHAVLFEEILHRYCNPMSISSVRALNIEVLKLQEDPKYLHESMSREIKKAIDDDFAEVILLGCTMEAGQFVELQKEFGIPIIDSTVAALKVAEMLVECKKKCEWEVSRIGAYETPPQKEMEEFGLI